MSEMQTWLATFRETPEEQVELTNLKVSKGLNYLIKAVAISKRVLVRDYAASILRPAAIVDHTEMSGGKDDFDIQLLARLIAIANGITVEDYKAMALRRQVLLDFAAALRPDGLVPLLKPKQPTEQALCV